jgi:L-aspartate oxidase
MNPNVFQPDELRTAEVLIVGGGVAGLNAAIHAKGRAVTMIGKTAFATGGSSALAQGGVAAALGGDDSPKRHAADTIAAGAGLCDPHVVRRVTVDGPRRIGELLIVGAELDRRADGNLALGREAAHSRRRVAHASGDSTGAELVRALGHAVSEARNVSHDDDTLALDLVLDRGAVVGVMAVNRDGCQILYIASQVVLATGGIGRLWSHTTNPDEATGDGLAMAIRAGASVADLEFMQFHPTALAVGGTPMPLLTEALRGEGAILIDERGARFMLDEHPAAEMAPRDIVARAIWRLLRDGGSVFLDATRLADRLEDQFPTAVRLCREHGLDLSAAPVPVAPAAHYHMGGVVVDAEGRSSLPGLWVVGEAARTGLHGANRLASNSLLEALVYGAAAGEAFAAECGPPVHPVRAREAVSRAEMEVAASPWLGDSPPALAESEADLRALMWANAGLERDAASLHLAAFDLREAKATAARGRREFDNSLLVARMVVRAARNRTESRGAHFRSDFPNPRAYWRQELVFKGERMRDPHPVVAAAAAPRCED